MRHSVRYRQLKYIKVVTNPNGKRYIYYSEPRKRRVRLPNLPHNHPEFLLAYLSATESAEKVVYGSMPKTGTIAALIVAYKKSDHFAALRPSTQANRRRILDKISNEVGAAKYCDLRPNHIKHDISKFNPHPANNRLKAWRGLCLWAEEAGVMNDNPAKSVSRKKTPKTDGHIPWSLEEIAQFRAFWPIGTMQRLSMEVLYWTAVRSVDLVRLSECMIDKDGWLNFTQEKTSGKVSIPWSRALPRWAEPMAPDQELLHTALRARRERHLTLITTIYGGPRSNKSFSQWFSAAAIKAELPKDRSSHGLRKSRAIAIAESGGTVHQIGAWTGHETLSEISHYSKAADKKKLLSDTKRDHILETASKQFPITSVTN